MREKSDAELLRHFVHERVDAAFAEVVKRHVGLVFAVARRQVGGDAHLAQDVTQRVFTDLARKAASLAEREVLGGWLFRSAQFAASDVVRAERRRRAREVEAQIMHETNQAPAAAGEWEKLRPMLDEAVGALGARERDALVLRFFEGRAWAEVGARLQVSEDAARRRCERALEKLRGLLAKRGITSTSAALGAVLTQQVGAVPAELAASIATTAVSGATGVAAPLAGLGSLGFMSSIKLTLGAGGLAAGAIVLAVVQYRAAQTAVAESAALRQVQNGLQARLGKLEQDLAQAAQRARSSDADNAALLEAIAAARPGATRPAAAGGAAELTAASVQARFKAARELAAAGKSAEALGEMLWCLDEGMVKVSNLSGIRASMLSTELQKLAKTFPPAAAALRERRDAAERTMADAPKERQPAADFALLNQTLDEVDKTLAAFDRLSPGDERRAHLANPQVMSRLVEGQRYAEVLEVYPYGRMSSMLSTSMRMPNVTGHPDPEGGLRRYREGVLQTSARNLEALLGAGDVKNAGVFAQQVLLFDDTPETRALLERHATRAGKAGFVATLGK